MLFRSEPYADLVAHELATGCPGVRSVHACVLRPCTDPVRRRDGGRRRAHRHTPVAAVRAAITADAVRRDVAELSSDDMGGRYFRSPFAEKAAAWISKRFDAIGLAHGAGTDTYRQPIDPDPATGPNLIARLDPPAGADRAAGTIIVSAHYDHLQPKNDGANRIYNGADDDASGIAGVLGVARAMKALAADGKIGRAHV